jgi:uncharacterized protein (DUF362 family)
MNRREFCHKITVVGGTIALAPLVKACKTEPVDPTQMLDLEITPGSIPTNIPTTAPTSESIITPTTGHTPTSTMEDDSLQPQPTHAPTVATDMAQVALVRSDNRADGTKRAIALLGLNPARGNRVLLKPNFNSADQAPGSTHPDVLRALIMEIYDMGARSITVGDRSGMGNTRAVMEKIGVMDLAAELGFDTLVFDDLSENDWTIRRSSDFHWSDGFAVPKALLDAECVIQTCNLKTHRYGGHFTLSLKNSVGLAAKTVGGGHDYMSELHGSPHQRLMIAEINEAYSPGLIVMDGVEAFVNGGPANGKKVPANVVLAGTDRVALDAVGVAILRLFGTTREVSQGMIFEQEQIARAVELGLGVDSPQKIRFLTGDPESERFASKVQQMLLL